MSTTTDSQLFEKLKVGPAVIYLGQNYLQCGNAIDPFLKILKERYPDVTDNGSISCYLGKLGLEDRSAILGWLHRRSEKISISEPLAMVSDFAWHNVYSSALDEVWVRAFSKPWRSLNPIFTDRLYPQDIRNRHRLSATFLFGCVNKEDNECRIPLDDFELDERRQAAVVLLRRLPDILTPRGALLIDGWDSNADWIRSEDFYPVLKQLEPGQVFLFSPTAAMRMDNRLRKLAATGVLQFVNQSLGEFLQTAASSESVIIGDPGTFLATGRQITIEGKPCFIPKEICLEVERFGVILDDNLTLPPRTRTRSLDDNYFEFLRFLEQPVKLRNWDAYSYGFSFERDCFHSLFSLVTTALKAPGDNLLPFILHGETGTGKSVTMAHLAYKIASQADFPVVFIDRTSKAIEWRVLDRFFNWAEDSSARANLLVWDGMMQEQDYLQLRNRLSDRGRKIVVVGSCYFVPDSEKRKNYVLAKRAFEVDERRRFTDYLKKFAPDLAAKIQDQGPRFIDPTFLVALYRLLPPVRPTIRVGVSQEVRNDQDVILNRIRQLPAEATGFNTLAIALDAVGIKGDPIKPWVTETEVHGETMNTLQRLFATVMTVGRYGCNVPIELLLAALDQPARPALLECLKSNSLVWFESPNGDLSVGPRHPLEAQLYIESLFGGNAEPEATIICSLILALPRSNAQGKDNTATDFIIELLRLVGPNSINQFYRERFSKSTLSFAKALTEARTTRGVVSSRLMLQEATFYREGVRQAESILALNVRTSLLKQAVGVLEQAQAIPTQSRRQQSVINEELAACLGTLIHNEADTVSKERVLELYSLAQDAVRKARTADPDNVHAAVTLGWISRSLLEQDLFEPQEKNEVSAELLSLFDEVEEFQMDYTQQQYYLRERMRLMAALGNTNLSDAAFDQLCKIGSNAGYYLRARSRFDELSSDALSPGMTTQVKSAVAYLEQNWAHIENDFKCINLYFTLWWRLRVSSMPFEIERTVLPFSDEDWQKCFLLCEKLCTLSGNDPRPKHRFLRALSAFHTDRVEMSHQEFRRLGSDNTISVGGRRLRKMFMASKNCRPLVFNGHVLHPISEQEVGRIYVDQIRSVITVIPRDFDKRELLQNESLSDFNIAFAFTGAIAQPAHFLRPR